MGGDGLLGHGELVVGDGHAGPPFLTSLASARFIDSDPMKVATNRLSRGVERHLGVSTCCGTPSLSTATQVPEGHGLDLVMGHIDGGHPEPVVQVGQLGPRVDTRSLASRLDRGSSIRNAWGSRTIARPMATRWRCPPTAPPACA